jgi:ribosomal protein S18 acetylase RimI-like enzyme
MKLDVQVATRHDVEEIALIEREAMTPDFYPEFFFVQALSLCGDGFLKGMMGNQIGGYGLMGRHFDAHVAELYSLVIAQQYRRLGLGAKIVEVAIDTARKWGVSELKLTVSPTNEAAADLYSRSGFTTTAEIANYYGPGEDRLLMTHTL